MSYRLAVLATLMGLCGCRSDSGPNPISVPNPDVSGGVNVETFGAIGADSIDDTQEIEAAIASLPSTGGTILIPSGVYLLSALHTGPYRALDLSDARNITIRGEGAGQTVLRMAPGAYQGSISTIWIQNSAGISIRGLTIDGNRAEVFYGDEQSHTLSIVSSSDVDIDSVGFINTGGDGVRLLGAPVPGDPWTERVKIGHSFFTDIWRNGISIQRSVRNVGISSNTFTRVSDQSISSEPSGQGGPSDIVIEDNVIHHSTGNWAVALAGINATNVLQRVEFRRNQIENGAVYFLQTSGLNMTENTVLGDARHPPLRLHDVDNAVIFENDFTATNDSDEGAVQVVNDGNNFSANVTIDANEIGVGAGMTGVYVRDASNGITIRGNGIRGLNGSKGIRIENVLITGASRSAFIIDQNVIDNFRYGIQLSTRGDLFSQLEISGNDIDHDQTLPSQAIGIALIGFPSTGEVEMIANVFGQGLTRILCIIGGNGTC